MPVTSISKRPKEKNRTADINEEGQNVLLKWEEDEDEWTTLFRCMYLPPRKEKHIIKKELRERVASSGLIGNPLATQLYKRVGAAP